MVIITYMMENTMNAHPVEFIGKLSTVLKGIFTDTVNADEKITGKSVPLAIIKGDYICEVIVLKLLLVDLQYIIIRTENNGYITYSPDFTFSHKPKPTVIQSPGTENKIGILKIIRNHLT